MGQYFKFVNTDKKEYLDPYCCGDVSKLIEITTGNVPALVAYLLRQSSEFGGGDIDTKDQARHMHKWCLARAKEEKEKGEDNSFSLEQAARYKKSIKNAINPEFAGRWAGDRIALVGDYDKSNLYEIAQDEYRNISHETLEEYNQFVGEESFMIFPSSYHKCEVLDVVQYIKEMEGSIANYREMVSLGNCSYKTAQETIEYYKNKIAAIEAKNLKVRKWKFQTPKSGKNSKRKGALAPDMVLQ